MYRIIKLIFIIVLLSIVPVNAENTITGEIININYQHKIAFTDISSYYLNVGDIVEISRSNKLIGQLEVSEASDVLSKLIPVKNLSKITITTNFKEIKVGDNVIKKRPVLENQKPQAISEIIKQQNITQTISGPTQNNTNYLKDNKELFKNYVTLSNNLAEILNEKSAIEKKASQTKQQLEIAMKQMQELEYKNKELSDELIGLKSKKAILAYKKKIKKLEKTISVLKEKLEKMATLLEGK